MQLEPKVGSALEQQLLRRYVSDSTICFIPAADGDRVRLVSPIFPVLAVSANDGIFIGNMPLFLNIFGSRSLFSLSLRC